MNKKRLITARLQRGGFELADPFVGNQNLFFASTFVLKMPSIAKLQIVGVKKILFRL
tara:strand:+ start:2793 stop:2963 length:171 start_codon:yes stop_codon:yes gene_type:complete